MSEERDIQFQAEIQQLLDIVIHSIYSNRDVFLRELISNASDALDKRRFLALTQKEIAENNLFIKLVVDSKKRTLTIRDNGIGMTEEEVVENIGTIAKSGTRSFVENLKKSKKTDRPELIGQFGIGFYSSFMVAEKVTLHTLKAGGDKPVLWTSSGQSGYTIAPGTKKEPGTEVTLHLRKKEKDDDTQKDYTQEWTLKSLVKSYSDFVTYPIKMDVEKENKDKKKEIVEETLNSMKAIWTRPKSEVKDEEYNEFYKQLSHDYTDPMEVIPFSAEGTIEYQALLFLPGKRPHDIMYRDGKRGLNLYVKRIFIMGDCDKILPEYMRFVRGIVDSADLSLNISRELLQENRQIDTIRKRLTKKILDVLGSMKKNERSRYLSFWKEFGEVLKEGLVTDYTNADEIKDLLLFKTTRSSEFSSLEEVAERMPDTQKELYFITGESQDNLENSPLLEAFRAKNYEVIYMTDRVDEFMMQGLQEYKGKKLKHVNKGDLDLSSDEEKKALEKKEKAAKEKFGSLLESLQKALSADIKEVRLSRRLKDSASCLVADEDEMTAQMQNIFKQMGQNAPASKKILELNPEHGVVHLLQKFFDANQEDPRIGEYGELLYQQALLAEGIPLKNPVKFAQKVASLMVASELSYMSTKKD